MHVICECVFVLIDFNDICIIHCDRLWTSHSLSTRVRPIPLPGWLNDLQEAFRWSLCIYKNIGRRNPSAVLLRWTTINIDICLPKPTFLKRFFSLPFSALCNQVSVWYIFSQTRHLIRRFFISICSNIIIIEFQEIWNPHLLITNC
jgi:hypothetical protein